MHSFIRKQTWIPILGALSLAGVFLAPNPDVALAQDNNKSTQIQRLSGPSRISTAANTAMEAYPGGTQWAIITGADDWSSTLASSALAGQLQAAQLLSYSDKLDKTEEALDKLGVKNIILVGTINEISGAIERSLGTKYEVERISPTELSGDNQYQISRLLTARAIVAAKGRADEFSSIGGTATPTPEPNPSDNSSASPSPTLSPSVSVSPSVTATPSDSTSPNPTVSPSASASTTTRALPTGQTLKIHRAMTNNPRSLKDNPNWNVPPSFGRVDGKRMVFIASGNAFPDALAASGLSYAHKIPVLFSDKTVVSEHTLQSVKALAPDEIVVLGGTGAISDDAIRSISSVAPQAQVKRLSGRDRVSTSKEVADFAVKELGFNAQNVAIARGDQFPDAMTAAQFVATKRAPLVLSAMPEYLPEQPVNFVVDNCSNVNKIIGFGGTAAIADSVLDAMSYAAINCQVPKNLPQVIADDNGSNPSPSEGPTRTPRPTTSPAPTTSPSPTDEPTTRPTPRPTSSGAPSGSSDATKTVVTGVPWALHPEVNRKVNTNVSGLVDKISTLSILSITGTNDGSKLPSRINWGLLPCNAVRLDGSGAPIFSDENGDGYADSLGHSSNDGIEITGINGLNADNGKLLLKQKVIANRTNAVLTAGIDDCSWVVAFDPADNNKIKVSPQGRPITPIGLGWLRIANGPIPGSQKPRQTNPLHIYNVTPTSSTKKAGQSVELSVTRKDGKPITEKLTIGTIPCNLVTLGRGDVLMSPMPSDSRGARAYGESATNNALVTAFNGKVDANPRRLFLAKGTGKFEFTVTSPKADCAAFSVVAGNGNGKLDIDSARRPVEPFGIATVEWTK